MNLQIRNTKYPFGMLIESRKHLAYGGDYMYGYNGQMIDKEIKGEGNHIDFKFRGYDPRLGRFFSIDPLFKEFSWNTPYAFAENDVIRHIDLEGLEKGTRVATNTKTAIDNTRPQSSANELLMKAYTPSSRSFLDVYKPNSFETFREQVLTYKEDDNIIEKSGKFTGNILYNTVNDVAIYGNKLIGLPPTDLEGHLKNDKEVTDAGIGVITNLVPLEGSLKATASELKTILNYSKYVNSTLTEIAKKTLPTSEKILKSQKSNASIIQNIDAVRDATNVVGKTTKGGDFYKESKNTK